MAQIPRLVEVPMKVCFVVTGFFGWGKYGGFGRLSRILAEELLKRGVEVHVLMQKSQYTWQPDYEEVDGIHIHTFLQKLVTRLGIDHVVRKLAENIDADIYHGQAINLWSFHSQQGNPNAKHIITCQDPPVGEMWKKWRKSADFPNPKGFRGWGWLKIIYNWMKKQAICKADLVCSQTKYYIPLVRKEYGLNYDPLFLPNPVEVPNHNFHKSDEPTILFLARWDRVKRPWIFFKIAKEMPNIHFICAGKSHSPPLDHKLRSMAQEIPNLECPGHLNPNGVLEKSWVLVNCSLKEALPMTFLEACAYKCTIVSCHNPDGFASRFGVHIKNGTDVDEYVSAIKSLISDENEIRTLGQSAYEYVKETHELNRVIDRHLEIYLRLLQGERIIPEIITMTIPEIITR